MKINHHIPAPWHFNGNGYAASHGIEYEITSLPEGHGVWTAHCQSKDDASLVRLAPQAPHDCNIPNCPGRENKRKLDLFDDLLSSLQWVINNLPAGIEWGGPYDENHPQGEYRCLHCDARWLPNGPEIESHKPECGLPKIREVFSKAKGEKP